MAKNSRKTAKERLAEKRAAALRENLKRRKDAARAQDEKQDDKTEKS